MNENPLYSERAFWKQEEKSNKKTSAVKNPEKQTKTEEKAVSETTAVNLVNNPLTPNAEKTIQYLKNFSESAKQQKNLENVLQNLGSKKFAKVFLIEDEKVREEAWKVIAEISYYLLYLCFTKFFRDTKSEDMEPYYQSLIRVVKVIIKIFDDEKNVKSSTRANLSRFFREITLQIVRYDKYKLKYLEKIALIDGILIALNGMDIANINSRQPEIFKEIIAQLESYLKYIKFLADFYSKGNQRIPFEMEVIAYMAYEAKNENQFFQLDLIPDTSDADSNWRDIYACTYRTVPQVEPQTYKKYYQYHVKADRYYWELKIFKESIDKLENRDQITTRLITLLYVLYKVGDYDAGIMIVELGLNIYKNTNGKVVYLATLSEAQKILGELAEKQYKLDERHPWIKKIPEHIEFVKLGLDECKSDTQVENREESIDLIIIALRNLYCIGSKAAGLMLARMSTEYFVKNAYGAYRYSVSFKEASQILNGLLLEKFEPKECEAVQKAIKAIEDEVLSETDDETTGIELKKFEHKECEAVQKTTKAIEDEVLSETDDEATGIDATGSETDTEDEEEIKQKVAETAKKIAKLSL